MWRTHKQIRNTYNLHTTSTHSLCDTTLAPYAVYIVRADGAQALDIVRTEGAWLVRPKQDNFYVSYFWQGRVVHRRCLYDAANRCWKVRQTYYALYISRFVSTLSSFRVSAISIPICLSMRSRKGSAKPATPASANFRTHCSDRPRLPVWLTFAASASLSDLRQSVACFVLCQTASYLCRCVVSNIEQYEEDSLHNIPTGTALTW